MEREEEEGQGERWKGRNVEEGVSHTLYGIKAEQINKENTPTNKLLIFVFYSKNRITCASTDTTTGQCLSNSRNRKERFD